MHAKIFEIGWCRTLVLNSGETREPILVNIYSQRRDAIDKHVDAQVKLVAINQVRLVHVALYNHVLNYALLIRVHRFVFS